MSNRLQYGATVQCIDMMMMNEMAHLQNPETLLFARLGSPENLLTAVSPKFVARNLCGKTQQSKMENCF